jgi:hypothetical protein
MNDDVCISSYRRGEVSIEGNIEGEMMVFGDVKHSSTEVSGSVNGLVRSKLQNSACLGVIDGIKRLCDKTRGRRVEFVTQALCFFCQACL